MARVKFSIARSLRSVAVRRERNRNTPCCFTASSILGYGVIEHGFLKDKNPFLGISVYF